MIPFSVKLVWFSLALTGLSQCWIILIYFGKKVGGLWGRLYYCVSVTLLEGMFCIGMIWHMDPSRMPRIFCMAQVIAFSLGSFALAGIFASFTLACAHVVFRPRSVNTGRAVLAWHRCYIPLTIIFPIAASATHIALLIRTDAVKPSLSDDLHCDATDPLWMRFVGYSGVPVILTIPSLILASITAYRMYKVGHTHSLRGTNSFLTSMDIVGEYNETGLDRNSIDGRNTRSFFEMRTFLLYPGRARPNKANPTPPIPAFSLAEQTEKFPLHKHPFPVIDPLTRKPYCPMAATRAMAQLSSSTDPSHQGSRAYGGGHLLEKSIIANPQASCRPRERDVRYSYSTPESTVSSTMPVFALRCPTALAAAANGGGSDSDDVTTKTVTEGNSVQLSSSGEKEGTQIVLDIASNVRLSAADRDQEMGLRCAHDIIPRHHNSYGHIPSRQEEPSSLKPEIRGSPPRAENSSLMDWLRETARSQRSTLEPRTGLGDTKASSEIFSDELEKDGGHERSGSPSGRSRRSWYSTKEVPCAGSVTLSHKGDQITVPCLSISPATSGEQSMVPEYDETELSCEMTFARRMSSDGHLGWRMMKKERKSVDCDDESSSDNLEIPAPVYKRSNLEQRLGIYNPTPPMGPTADMLKRRQSICEQAGGYSASTEMRTKLGSVMWRMILFQISFCLIQLLACLSPLVDVVQHTITPFGTQHVALLLAAWAPLYIFVPLPTIPCFLNSKRE